MNNLELVSFDLDSYATTNSPGLTEMDQEVFSTVGGLFNETSCSKISCDVLLSSNREHAMKYISNSHIV